MKEVAKILPHHIESIKQGQSLLGSMISSCLHIDSPVGVEWQFFILASLSFHRKHSCSSVWVYITAAVSSDMFVHVVLFPSAMLSLVINVLKLGWHSVRDETAFNRQIIHERERERPRAGAEILPSVTGDA